MRRVQFYLLFASLAAIVSCGTTDSAVMYDPNAPVTAITISTSGSVDPSSRTIALPPGDDELLVAFRDAFSADGWNVSTSTTDSRYVMQLETKVWTYDQKLSAINLSIVDARTGAQILTGFDRFGVEAADAEHGLHVGVEGQPG